MHNFPKAIGLLLAIAFSFTAAQAQTTIYEYDFRTDLGGWTLSSSSTGNITRNNTNGIYIQSTAAGSTATSPAIIPANATNLSITISGAYCNYVALQHSPNGTTWSPATTITSGDRFEGCGDNYPKVLPNGTRYVRFFGLVEYGTYSAIIHSVKIQTHIYINNFLTGSTGWTLSNVTRDNTKGLVFATAGGTATSTAIIPAGSTDLSIAVTGSGTDAIYLQYSSDGTTWLPNTTTSSGDALPYSTSNALTALKPLPDGTRYVRFFSRFGSSYSIKSVIINGIASNGAQPYTVTFETNGGSAVASQSVYHKGFLPQPQDPTKEGSIFYRWYKEAEFRDDWYFGSTTLNSSSIDKMPDKDITLYARWSEKISVAFETNGGTDTPPREYHMLFAYNTGTYTGTNYTYSSKTVNNPGLPNPTKANSYFYGWYESPDFSDSRIEEGWSVRPTTPTLYARWLGQTTIAFETNGGNAIASQPYSFGYAYNATNEGNTGIPTPTKANAIFLGWYDNPSFSETPITAESIVGQTTTKIYAKWSDRKSIAFETNGGTAIADKNFYPLFAYNATAEGNTGLPANPTKANSHFLGWYDNSSFSGTPITAESIVGQNVTTLYAKWLDNFPVVFETSGGTSIANKSFFPGYAFNASPNTGLPANPTKGANTFIGWLDRNKNTVTNETIVNTTHDTIWASWEVNAKFITHGGNDVADQKYVSGLAFNSAPNSGLPTPTKTGYVFGAWYNDLGYENQRLGEHEVPLILKDTLYAKWDNAITVTFEPGNGTAATTRQYFPFRNYNSSVTYEGTTYNQGFPADPTADSKRFLGWFNSMEEQILASQTVPNNPHILYARWSEKITVAFETGGGTTIPAREYFPMLST